MQQRALILKSWARHSAEIPDSPAKRKAQTFFDMVANEPGSCWEEIAGEFRRNYYDVFDEIVPTLLDTDDPLIIYHCVHNADLQNPKEVSALQHLVRECDCRKHQVSFRDLAATRSKALVPLLEEREDLPKSVRFVLGREEPPRSAKAPEKGKKAPARKGTRAKAGPKRGGS